GLVGWDVTSRLGGNPAGNNIPAGVHVKPSTFFDVMNPGRLTDEAWIEPSNYTTLFNSPTLSTAPDARNLSARVAVISGIFDPSGNQLLRFNPVFRYPWKSGPPPPPVGEIQNRYVAELTDTTGKVTDVPFAALVDSHPNEQEGGTRFGDFEIMV